MIKTLFSCGWLHALFSFSKLIQHFYGNYDDEGLLGAYAPITSARNNHFRILIILSFTSFNFENEY